MRGKPEVAKTASASETMTARLGDLPDVSQSQWFRENMSDSLVTLRVSHRYLKTMETPEKSCNHLGETSLDSAEQPSQHSPLGPIADQDGNWSSALLDHIHSDPEPTLLSENTKCDENSFVNLNQFCYFCRQLCKESRAFNTYVHEVDAAMPWQEPSSVLESSDSQLPHSQIREYFDFWPSSAAMLSSAQNGCHLCTIVCQQLIDRLRLYQKSGCAELDHLWALSKSSSLGKPQGNHDSPRCIEAVPSSSPLQFVVCWTWWLHCPRVVRNLYLAWPLKGRSNSPQQGSHFLGSHHYVALERLDIDASRRKSEKLSGYPFSSLRIRKSQNPEAGKGHLLSAYTGSDSWLKLANGWIHTCHRMHSCHRDPSCTRPEMPFRPTRLLDVGDSDGLQSPRLNIKQSSSGRVQYLALSHCWGQNPKSLYKLTEETEEALLQGVPVEKLSRTFQDAVKVCRKLNQRYIWIDSLCIKQDSPEDWIQEAAQMHLVYANSYCTIAAVCASGSEEGFLRSPNPLSELRLSVS